MMRQSTIICTLLLAGFVVAAANAEEIQRSVTVSAQSEIVVGLIDAEVTNVERLKFRVRDQRPHQREARRLAFESAREKATHLAELSGLMLGDVITVHESVPYNDDAGGYGGMGSVAISNVAPQRSFDDVVAVSGCDAAAPVPQTVFRNVVFRPQKPETVQAGPSDTRLLAPGAARLNATVTVKFELWKPHAAPGAASRLP